MYTNPHHIIQALLGCLERNRDTIDGVIHVYEPSKSLTIFEGMRKTLPASSFPSLEIEPTSSANQWATTRAQRPRYSFDCTLTVLNGNEKFGVEYISTIITILTQIMTDPTNLQLPVPDEKIWDPDYGLLPTVITDSLVENVTNNASKDGSIRVAQFDWWVLIHEPYPNFKWRHESPTGKTQIIPPVLS